MLVAITGGTGLIGQAIAEHLRERGDDVVLVSRSPGPDTVVWDPKTPGSLKLPEATEAVVHLAGAPIIGQRWTSAYKRELLESRALGTKTMVRAVQDHGEVHTVVSQSAVDYYGDRGEEALDEDAAPGESFLAGVCQAWEEATLPLQKDPDVALAISRTGIVLDQADGALAEMLNPFWFVKPFHWGLGGPVGNGRQWFPWIHLEDEAGAILHLLDNRLEGPFNVTAPGVVRNKEFIQALGDVLGRPTKLPVPKVALKLLYGESAEVLFDSHKVVPDRLQAEGYAFTYPEAHDALEDLLG